MRRRLATPAGGRGPRRRGLARWRWIGFWVGLAALCAGWALWVAASPNGTANAPELVPHRLPGVESRSDAHRAGEGMSWVRIFVR
ncbi:hypothetical protein [Phaeacidiphilus oryzae]|jgi:type VI protein secretion system component VasK|uniref:hypothetical protein n=1 Tax=Phaeacidiphilus oryzae TaxID=348818 RepID=UPI000559D049|nr:hypothetical protein [Phaeacidiphilus oryzae]